MLIGIEKTATPLSQCWAFWGKRRNAYVTMLAGLDKNLNACATMLDFLGQAPQRLFHNAGRLVLPDEAAGDATYNQ